VEASQPYEIARRLASDGYRVRAYDPLVRDVPEKAELMPSIEECLAEADACVIATAWDEFKRLTRRELERTISPDAIIDCWRLLDEPRAEPAHAHSTI